MFSHKQRLSERLLYTLLDTEVSAVVTKINMAARAQITDRCLQCSVMSSVWRCEETWARKEHFLVGTMRKRATEVLMILLHFDIWRSKRKAAKESQLIIPAVTWCECTGLLEHSSLKPHVA